MHLIPQQQIKHSRKQNIKYFGKETKTQKKSVPWGRKRIALNTLLKRETMNFTLHLSSSCCLDGF